MRWVKQFGSYDCTLYYHLVLPVIHIQTPIIRSSKNLPTIPTETDTEHTELMISRMQLKIVMLTATILIIFMISVSKTDKVKIVRPTAVYQLSSILQYGIQ